jgi:hypothetical protein
MNRAGASSMTITAQVYSAVDFRSLRLQRLLSNYRGALRFMPFLARRSTARGGIPEAKTPDAVPALTLWCLLIKKTLQPSNKEQLELKSWTTPFRPTKF